MNSLSCTLKGYGKGKKSVGWEEWFVWQPPFGLQKGSLLRTFTQLNWISECNYLVNEQVCTLYQQTRILLYQIMFLKDKNPVHCPPQAYPHSNLLWAQISRCFQEMNSQCCHLLEEESNPKLLDFLEAPTELWHWKWFLNKDTGSIIEQICIY